MRLEQLHYIIAIADNKSMSKAAKETYISQPALSNALKSLETELGFTIFDRTLKGIILTPKGEELYKIACSIEQNIERIHQLSLKNGSKNELHIGTVPMACGFSFVDMIDSIKIAFPELELTVNELRPTQLWKAIEKESLRIAICCYTYSHQNNYLKMVKDIHLSNELLLKCPMMVYLPEDHPLANETIISLENLKNNPIYCFPNDKHTTNNLEELFKNSPIHYVSSRENIKDAVAHKKGIAFLPASMILDDIYIECGKIKAVPLKERVIVNMELLHPKDSLLTEQEIAILEIIRCYSRKMNARIKCIYESSYFMEELSENLDLFY